MDDYTVLYLYLTRCSLVVTLVVQLLPLEAQQEALSSPRTAPGSARVGARIRFPQLEADLAHVWAHLVSVRTCVCTCCSEQIDLLDAHCVPVWRLHSVSFSRIFERLVIRAQRFCIIYINTVLSLTNVFTLLANH